VFGVSVRYARGRDSAVPIARDPEQPAAVWAHADRRDVFRCAERVVAGVLAIASRRHPHCVDARRGPTALHVRKRVLVRILPDGLGGRGWFEVVVPMVR
jgi:hypothetical protein